MQEKRASIRSSGPKNHRSSTVRLLVADENRMNCQLLITALQRYRRIQVVARATSSEQILSGCRTNRPTVALISATLQDGSLSGFSAVRELRVQSPETRTILLVDSAELGLVIDAFRVGAKGIFCREDSLNSLCRCIESVHAGQIWANSIQLESVLDAFARVAPPRLVEANGQTPLSKRELQVAQLVSEGHSNREIAQQLSLSQHTVKNYLFHIFEKLGMSSRVELVLYARTLEKGPLDLGDSLSSQT